MELSKTHTLFGDFFGTSKNKSHVKIGDKKLCHVIPAACDCAIVAELQWALMTSSMSTSSDCRNQPSLSSVNLLCLIVFIPQFSPTCVEHLRWTSIEPPLQSWIVVSIIQRIMGNQKRIREWDNQVEKKNPELGPELLPLFLRSELVKQTLLQSSHP